MRDPLYVILRMPVAAFFGGGSAVLFTDPTPRNLLMAIPMGLVSLYLVFLCTRECVRNCKREP